MKNLGIMTAVISPMLADGVTVNEKALTAILEDLSLIHISEPTRP